MWAFEGCKNLEEALLGDALTNISGYAFQNCTNMRYIIVRATTPPTIAITTFENSNNCPIYVPDKSVAAYKEATNWVEYVDRIKPLSEYVEQ